MGKMGNGTVTQSEESMILMTAYGFPHRGSRSFIFVQDDALPAFLTTTADSSHLLRMTPCECIAIRHWLAANSD